VNPETVRADLWLWAARFFKTRSLAKHAIEGGRIEVNDGPCKPSRALHVGDRMRIRRGEERMEIEVLALSARRGSASVAQTLYRETEDSVAARAQALEQRRLTGAGLDHPPARPDKRARRALRGLKGN
jgi:ribosome-associated heat shock protein Hsp15